jgi:hypothetical protein
LWLIEKNKDPVRTFYSNVAVADDREEAKAWCEDKWKTFCHEPYIWEPTLRDPSGLIFLQMPGKIQVWRISKILSLHDDEEWQKEKIKDLVI